MIDLIVLTGQILASLIIFAGALLGKVTFANITRSRLHQGRLLLTLLIGIIAFVLRSHFIKLLSVINNVAFETQLTQSYRKTYL